MGTVPCLAPVAELLVQALDRISGPRRFPLRWGETSDGKEPVPGVGNGFAHLRRKALRRVSIPAAVRVAHVRNRADDTSLVEPGTCNAG